MIHHVSYIERQFHDPRECLAGVRGYIDLGWTVSQIRGPRDGPYLVVFRMDD